MIFKWLVNHLLFAGTTFFAAGAVALGGDAGAADAGADTGADDSAALGEGVSGVDGAPHAADAAEAQEGDVSQSSNKPATHRAVLETFTKSEEFKTLAAQKPEVAKAITRLQQSLKSISEALAPVGGLKNAQQLARVLSEAGGVEAITGMKAKLAEIDAIDAKLESGDPPYITDIAANMPEQFNAMMPHAIDKWAESNPDDFTRLIAQNVVPNLFSDDPDEPGIANLIARAHEMSKDPETQKILKGVYQWCKNVAAQAKAKPAAKGVNPDAKKLEERQKELDKRENEQFEKGAWSQVDGYSLPLMRSEIKRQFGKTNVSDETIADLSEGVQKEMQKRAAGDQDFQRNMKAARDRKDQAKLIEVGKQFATKNIPEAVKTVYGRRYRGMGIVQQTKKVETTANAKNPPAVPKAVVIPVKPKDAELILNTDQLNVEQRKVLVAQGYRTIQQATMANIGFTKTGKVVQWQKDR